MFIAAINYLISRDLQRKTSRICLLALLDSFTGVLLHHLLFSTGYITDRGTFDKKKRLNPSQLLYLPFIVFYKKLVSFINTARMLKISTIGV